MTRFLHPWFGLAFVFFFCAADHQLAGSDALDRGRLTLDESASRAT